MDPVVYDETRCPACYTDFVQVEGEPQPPTKIIWGCGHVICFPCAMQPSIQSCVICRAAIEKPSFTLRDRLAIAYRNGYDNVPLFTVFAAERVIGWSYFLGGMSLMYSAPSNARVGLLPSACVVGLPYAFFREYFIQKFRYLYPPLISIGLHLERSEVIRDIVGGVFAAATLVDECINRVGRDVPVIGPLSADDVVDCTATLLGIGATVLRFYSYD